MYSSFYGLRELPFELTPNPRFLFTTPHHQEALSNLQFGLSTGKPLTVLIGEAGTGKTTLLRAALESDLCRHVKTTYISNPALKRDEFIELLARNFQLSSSAAHSKAAMLSELEVALTELRHRGELIALVVDEAQALSDELLEEIRLLANIETNEQKLLPLVLAGQPELASRLNRPNLRQLKQRVSLRCEIHPLDLSETASYVATRIRAAGGEPLKLFSREAIALIHERSRGIPRTISVICDNTLLSGFALGVQPVTRAIVAEVCRDFDFRDNSTEQLLRPLAEKREAPSFEVGKPSLVVSPHQMETRVPPSFRHPSETALTRLRSTLFGR
jgi:type II secretory pathway predicted ATPase ExeA